MNVDVYHVKNIAAENGRSLLGEIGWGDLPIDMDKNHELVATVEVHSVGTRALDEAYKLTQNIHESWVNGKFVQVKKVDGLNGLRSTHVGDVLVMGEETFVCAPIGWMKVHSADQRIVRG